MAEISDLDEAFPPYSGIAPLPVVMSQRERQEFAFKLLAEHGEKVGDYMFAAVRAMENHDDMWRWARMAELVGSIYGKPIALNPRTEERIAAEGNTRTRPG